jgi:hypothetical protein
MSSVEIGLLMVLGISTFGFIIIAQTKRRISDPPFGLCAQALVSTGTQISSLPVRSFGLKSAL